MPGPERRSRSTTAAERVTVKGNGLPKGTRTGVYPVSPASAAYDYDRNPNRIAMQANSWVLPKPAAAARPSCLSGWPIGIALNGVSIFDVLDAENRDAVAYEILDRCQGHPERNGRYHDHSIPACLTAGETTSRHSAIVGYALDGFPITGRRGDGGQLVHERGSRRLPRTRRLDRSQRQAGADVSLPRDPRVPVHAWLFPRDTAPRPDWRRCTNCSRPATAASGLNQLSRRART